MGLFGDAISNLPAVEAELNYLVPMREKPRNYATEPPPGVPGSNATHEAHRLAICDARPVAPDISGLRPDPGGEQAAQLSRRG